MMEVVVQVVAFVPSRPRSHYLWELDTRPLDYHLQMIIPIPILNQKPQVGTLKHELWQTIQEGSGMREIALWSRGFFLF